MAPTRPPTRGQLRRPPGARAVAAGRLAFVAMLTGVIGCEGCLSQRPLPEAPQLPPYPTCEGDASPGEVVELDEALRPGPFQRERGILERVRVVLRACHRVATVRLVNPIEVIDVEVVYEASSSLPLRAWRRRAPITAPDRGVVEVFELRTEPPVVARRFPDGTSEYGALKGPRPTAVVGPGRGILAVWIRDLELEVGDKDRRPVLDLTEHGEIDDEGSIRRDPGRDLDGSGVDVFTVYGRDTVFVDPTTHVVVGDLAGLRRASTVRDGAAPEIPPGLPTPAPRAFP